MKETVEATFTANKEVARHDIEKYSQGNCFANNHSKERELARHDKETSRQSYRKAKSHSKQILSPTRQREKQILSPTRQREIYSRKPYSQRPQQTNTYPYRTKIDTCKGTRIANVHSKQRRSPTRQIEIDT